jgi:hypothetical protein
MSHSTRFIQTLAAFDSANSQDPRQLADETGALHPSELLYGQRMSATLLQFQPQASEALQLAARSQHLERWQIPRASYPMDRAGYLSWRNALKQFHAERASAIMQAQGYEESTIARVASLLKKEQLKRDSESQTLEDIACLVFLRYNFTDFAAQHSDEKIIDIVQKTWRKMSDAGHQAALALPFTPQQQQLLARALGSE